MKWLVLLCLSQVCVALNFTPDLQQPLNENAQSEVEYGSTRRIKSIAVIGSGLAGATAAFYLRGPLDSERVFNITVFESEPVTGGQIASIQLPWPNGKLEAGAQSFAEDDTCMNELVRGVGLESRITGRRLPWEAPKRTGIWDTEDFIYIDEQDTSLLGSWWQSTRLLWKYGLTSRRFHQRSSAIMERVHQLGVSYLYLRDLHGELLKYDLLHLAGQPASSLLFDSNEFNADFINDFVRAAVRHRYTAELDEINVITAMTAMHDAQQHRVNGGNWLLPHRLMTLSEAQAMYGTTVQRISLGSHHRWRVTYFDQQQNTTATKESDSIVMTAPFETADIDVDSIPGALSLDNASTPYSDRYVAHFMDDRPLNPSSFHQVEDFDMPDEVLTAPCEPQGDDDIFSVTVPQHAVPRGQYDDFTPSDNVYRVTSKRPLSEAELARFIGSSNLDRGPISVGWKWIHQQRWSRAHAGKPPGQDALFGLKLGEDFWYTPSLRRVWDSMEMSCVAGRSVAQALRYDAW